MAGVTDTQGTRAGGLYLFALPSGANASVPCALRQLCRLISLSLSVSSELSI